MTEIAENVESSTPKLVLHHLNNSRSQRILWLLEELEVPYEIKFYQREASGLAPKELKNVHPLGKSPVIVDGDVTVAESAVIIEYIAEKYGGEKLKAPECGRLDNLYFMHYAEGSLMPVIVNKLIFTIIPQKTPFLLRFFARLICGGVIKSLIDPAIKQNCEFIEKHLEKTPGDWFAGGDHPTTADYQMIFPLEAMSARAPVGPQIQGYVKRVHDRPAYKRALEKGGPYDFA